MKNLILPPFLALFLMAAPLAASAIEDLDAKKIAIREFVASQNMAESWPEVVRVVSANGARQMREAAIEALRQASSLSDAERRRILDTVEQTIPQASAEMTEALKALDADGLMEDVALQVYGKYFTAAELRGIAKFYSGETGKKLRRLTPTLIAEAKSGSGSRADRYFTASEILEIGAFNNSPAARKMQETSAVVRRETQAIYSSRSAALTQPVVEKFQRRVAQLLAERQ